MNALKLSTVPLEYFEFLKRHIDVENTCWSRVVLVLELILPWHLSDSIRNVF